MSAAEAPGAAFAAVVFDGPGGSEGYVIRDGPTGEVPFGRGGQCPIRFGHAPVPDLRLARQAGSFLIAGDRLIVESTPQPSDTPIQIVVAGRPPFELPPGEAHGPAATEFEVVVRGEREWTLQVRTRARRPTPGSPVAGASDPPTIRRPLELTDHERRVLDAYVAPLRAGRLEPATHAEVAEQLSYSANKVRRDLYAIWQQMVTSGVVVPEYADKRVAVAQAAITNRIG